MDFPSDQFTASSAAINEEQLKNAVSNAREMLKLNKQAADDAIWRTAQNNAMAKVKGMAKLAEAANQLAN